MPRISHTFRGGFEDCLTLTVKYGSKIFTPFDTERVNSLARTITQLFSSED